MYAETVPTIGTSLAGAFHCMLDIIIVLVLHTLPLATEIATMSMLKGVLEPAELQGGQDQFPFPCLMMEFATGKTH